MYPEYQLVHLVCVPSVQTPDSNDVS